MLKLIGLGIIVSGILAGCSNGGAVNEQNFSPGTPAININHLENISSLSSPTQNMLPIAAITADENVCPVGNTITLNGSNSQVTAPDTQLVAYEWTTNGNIISTDSTVSLPCDTEGQKEVCLQVTDSDNQTDTQCYSYTISNKKTLPPKAIITVRLHPEHGFWFKCSASHDQDRIDSDHNSSNNDNIVQANWEIYQTIDGKRKLVINDNACNQWVDVSDELDLMEVTLNVTDDDNETASVTKKYTWNGYHLLEE